MTTCPICNGTIEYKTKTVTHKYKNHTKEIEQTGNYCSSCNEFFLSPKDLKVTQKELSRLFIEN